MKKPLSYFQFDYEEFRSRHYAEGYFSYERDGFGPVVKTVDKLVDELISSYEKGFKMEEEYKQKVDKTFIYRDHNNCERILKELLKISKRK